MVRASASRIRLVGSEPMERLVIAAVLVGIAVVVAVVLERRRTASVTMVPRSELPAAVDLAAVGLDGGPAIVVFSEETCRTCATALGVVRGPAGAGLPVAEVPFGTQRDVHRELAIDTVPTTVVVSADGNVVDGWIGRIDLTELALALAEALDRPPEGG